jgi:hypothetical protein
MAKDFTDFTGLVRDPETGAFKYAQRPSTPYRTMLETYWDNYKINVDAAISARNTDQIGRARQRLFRKMYDMIARHSHQDANWLATDEAAVKGSSQNQEKQKMTSPSSLWSVGVPAPDITEVERLLATNIDWRKRAIERQRQIAQHWGDDFNEEDRNFPTNDQAS